MIQGIHHFAIIVSREECIAFYTRLGFKIFKRIERKYDTVVLLYGHGIQIEAFVDPKHPSRSMPESVGLRHLALKVDDIKKTILDLGVETGSITEDWVGVKYCFITDFDGNPIELHE